MARDKDYRNSGFINFSYNDEDKCWSIGGTYTNEKGAEFDLGYIKTGTQNFEQAVGIIASQLKPTLAGKGIPRKERQQNGGGKGGPE